MKTTKTNEEILSEALTSSIGTSNLIFDLNDISIEIIKEKLDMLCPAIDSNKTLAHIHLDKLQGFSDYIRKVKNNEDN